MLHVSFPHAVKRFTLSFMFSQSNQCWVLNNTLNRGGIVVQVGTFGIDDSGSDLVRVKDGKLMLFVFVDVSAVIDTWPSIRKKILSRCYGDFHY